MATRYAVANGNWDSTATWSATSGGASGASVPVSGDGVNIDGDKVVTIPAGYSAASAQCVVGNTANSTGIATLIVNGTLTLDATFTLRVGQGASKDGKLIFGAGGSLVQGSSTSTIYLQNCYLESTATKASPFVITGAGNIDNTGTTTPRQDINIANVMFRNTGTIKFLLLDTTGTATSRLLLTNCVFAGTSSVTFGQTTTPSSTVMSVTNCDFRDMVGTRTITVQRATGGSATYEFKHNTLWQADSFANRISFSPATSTGLTVDQCVFWNVTMTNAAASGGINWSNVVQTTNAANSSVIILSDAGVGCTIDRAYFVSYANNLHPIATTGSGGSGTHTISNCTLDGEVDGSTFTDRPDLFLPGTGPLAIDFKNNLVIKTGNLFTGVTHPAFTASCVIRNNTIAGTISSSLSVAGTIYQPEGTANTGGSNISARSNLVLGNGSASDNAYQGASTAGNGAQTIGYSDYTRFSNVAVPYSASSQGLTVSAGNTGSPPSVPGGHESVTAPQFLDPTRNLARWNLFFGDGTATTTAALTYLAGALNGYRGTPNFDQNGTAMSQTIAQVIDWVREGYSPTNLALRGAGDPTDGSPDVGALPVRSKTTGMFF